MPEYEDESDVERLCEALSVGKAPGERGEGQEEGEKVGEGRVRAVVRFCCLFLLNVSVTLW